MASEVAHEVKTFKEKLTGKYEKTMGLRIWGKTATGVMVEVRVDDNGQLQTSNP